MLEKKSYLCLNAYKPLSYSSMKTFFLGEQRRKSSNNYSYTQNTERVVAFSVLLLHYIQTFTKSLYVGYIKELVST